VDPMDPGSPIEDPLGPLLSTKSRKSASGTKTSNSRPRSTPSYGVDLGLLLLVLVPEADFLLLVDKSGPNGSST
jgi:hypothetical protein